MKTKPISDAPIRRVARYVLYAVVLFLVVAARPALPAEDLLHGQGMLWQVEREDAAPSYVFGTMHVSDPRVLDLPPAVMEAFAGSRTVAFELLLTEEVLLRLGQAIILTDGRTLEAIIGPDLFDQAARIAAGYGIGRRQMQVFKPWALMTVFVLPPDELARITDGRPPLDLWLQIEAQQRGKLLYQLETVDEQIDLFDAMPEADQTAMLRQVVADHDMIDTWFETMTQHYLEEDIGAIHAMMVEQMAGYDQRLVESFIRRFIVARNERMVKRMAGMLGRGNAFIAVGALHLPGETGILHLLEQQGYRVRPIH